MKQIHKKWNTKSFIEAAKKVHGNKYDYSKTIYVNSKVHVIIKYDGDEYTQRPDLHLAGHKPEKMTTSKFIKKAKKVHGNKYDYSLTTYVRSDVKIKIIYKKVIYEQLPNSHLNGHIVETKIQNTEDFVKQAINIHGNKYNYSKTNYVNILSKVIIIYNNIEYLQRPDGHLLGYKPENAENYTPYTKEEFVKQANIVHDNKYTYPYDLLNVHTDIDVICQTHGTFSIRPSSHLQGYGCAKCSYNTMKMTTEEFTVKAISKHNGLYTYEKSIYTGAKDPIIITCAIHGDFIQEAFSHLSGCGCPDCVNLLQSLGSKYIRKFLCENNINFKTEKTFLNCRNKGLLRFDYYLTDLNICIEYDGSQHFYPKEKFGGQEAFDNRKINDFIKDNYCRANNIHLIRIPYIRLKYIENILSCELL
jgi:hypothetical protein